MTGPAEHVEKLIYADLSNCLVAADFPVFAQFTYGKHVNKTSKGTEKATDLLQSRSEKSRWI
jgi:hypothetical protein